MGLKKHHKILIGSFTAVIIAYMIVNGIFLYLLFIKSISIEAQIADTRKDTKDQILDVKTETQTKINDLSSIVELTQNDLSSQISQLKA
ncbi:MAG: hypothetical protein AABY22_01975, partial [Nanoarchaeota archaeon]